MQKRVINASNSAEISSRRYLYDGWNLIAEFNAPNGSSLGSLVRSYTWGLDIVRTFTSAGGVGALLQITDHAAGKTYLPTYDGNGNIAALLNADTGAAGAIYEYSPYGEPLRAQVNDATLVDQPFRFSTKFTDLETGLVYYGHRYYDPRNGRFINRDPIEEAGGLNLYGFVGNNPVNRWDAHGLFDPYAYADQLAANYSGGYGNGITISSSVESDAEGNVTITIWENGDYGSTELYRETLTSSEQENAGKYQDAGMEMSYGSYGYAEPVSFTYTYNELYRLTGENRVGDPNGNNGDLGYTGVTGSDVGPGIFSAVPLQ